MMEEAVADHLDDVGDGFLVVVTGNPHKDVRTPYFFNPLGAVSPQRRIVMHGVHHPLSPF